MNFYSLEKEIALGKSLAQQVEQQSRLIQDPVVAEYVNRVGPNTWFATRMPGCHSRSRSSTPMTSMRLLCRAGSSLSIQG